MQSYIISDEIYNENKSKISGNEKNEYDENNPVLNDEEDEYSENKLLLLEDEESEYYEIDPLLEDEEDDKERNELFDNDNEEISDNLIKGLRLFQIKKEYNISEAAFEKILKSLEIPGIFLFKLYKLLGNIIPLEPTFVDCCINSCIAFTGELINKDTYPHYKKSRYNFNKVA